MRPEEVKKSSDVEAVRAPAAGAVSFEVIVPVENDETTTDHR
jgi:hypothetical protein